MVQINLGIGQHRATLSQCQNDAGHATLGFFQVQCEILKLSFDREAKPFPMSQVTNRHGFGCAWPLLPWRSKASSHRSLASWL